MSNLDLVVHPAAESEIIEAAKYYRERSQQAALRFRSEIRGGFSRIVSFPDSWLEILPGYRRTLLSRFPYSIIYMVFETHIEIMAVAHHSRHPNYWDSRAPGKT